MRLLKTRLESYPALSLALVLPVLFLVGCAGSNHSQKEVIQEHDLTEVQPDDEILNILNGEVDSRNRFSSAVFVALSPDEKCSGVLIHPLLVLTAGHCVCRGRSDGGVTTLDSSSCEQAVTVRIGKVPDDSAPYIGRVTLHPDFNIVLQKKKLLVPPGVDLDHVMEEAGKRYVLVDVVIKSRADLALIALNQAIEGLATPIPLARTDIILREQVVTAGYGADDVKNGLVAFTNKSPIRRFGKNSIAKIDGERFILESPGALPLPGDSGGPCFREEAAGMVLVGINSRSTPGRKGAFTSTYRYLSWLKGELQRATERKPDTP